MPIIEAKNLTKIFGKNVKQGQKLLDEGLSKEEILKKTGTTVGVNRASFSVEEGEIFVIMGLSGSGKSTLVRLINRLIEPTEGNIFIDGEDLATMNKENLREVRRKKLSMVFQNFGLFPHRTVLDNAAFGLEIQKINKAEREKRATEALKLVGLGEYLHQRPSQLSGGMQQRVGLARALTNDPKVLLMDEAFSALDPLIRRDMQDELLELQKTQKRTIIFITHDLNESLRLGDRIAIMKDGKVVQIDTGEEILMNPADNYVKRFVEDIDRSRVFTAENIMSTPTKIIRGLDDLDDALERMIHDDLSNITVVDEEGTLQGYIIGDEAALAVGEGQKDLEPLIHTDIPRVRPTTLVGSLYDIIHDSSTPVAVVDTADKLLGIVVRGSVISALSEEGREEVLNN